MAKVQPLEDKDFAERKPYFEAGVHEVFISGMTKVEPETGAPYIEVEVLGKNDATDSIRVYISEKAAPYTLANLARIAVHNKDKEADKEKVREAFKKITDTDQLDAEFLAKFKDMQAWILTEEDTNAPKPKGGFYLRSSLYSWEPQAKTVTADDLTTKNMVAGGTPANDEVPFN